MAARLTTYLVVAIVAATLIAGLIVGAQRDDTEGPVDLIVHNARVFTAETNAALAEAVAIRGNQILRVGSNREINRLRRPQTTMIDAAGAAVLPGFNDAHVHLMAGGLGLDRIDLLGALSLEDLQSRIRTWADANPDRPWILGRGWRADAFEGGQPTRQALDAVVGHRPAILMSADGSAAWVSTAALRLARIERRTTDPENGAIAKDARTGQPTGLLTGTAQHLIARLVPKPTDDERGRALRAAIAFAHRNGITSIQDAGATLEDVQLYEAVRRSGDLDLRIYAALGFTGRVSESQLDSLDAIRARYPDDPLFKAGAVKIAIDGQVTAHTAAMLEPYATAPLDSGPIIGADDLNRIVRLLDARQWQVMSHAAGDRAVRMALDAYAHAVRSNPASVRGRRHRVEHAEIVDPSDLARFGPLGVIASMQPFSGSPEPSLINAWTVGLGADRTARAWPLRAVTTKGGKLALGSDWPAAPLNPMIELHTAVTRTTLTGAPEGGWQPSERLAIESAIAAYTSTAAYASFDEQRKGALKPGMLADLVVLTADIFSAPVADLASTRVAATIFDGKVVYSRKTDRTHTN